MWNDPKYVFTIYGDGKLLYTSPNMLYKQKPATFDIDISHVEELSINWNGGADTWYCELGLAEPMLYKGYK